MCLKEKAVFDLKKIWTKLMRSTECKCRITQMEVICNRALNANKGNVVSKKRRKKKRKEANT